MKTLSIQCSSIWPVIRKFSDKQKNQRLRFIILILTLSILNLSCHSYFKVTTSANPSIEKIADLNQSGKTIIIHFNDNKWLLTNVQVSDNIISGLKTDYRMPPTLKPIDPGKKNRYLNKMYKDPARKQSYLLNEVHLYLNHFNDEKTPVIIPITSIDRIDIYDKDKKSTTISWTIGIVGLAALGFAILVLFAFSSLDVTGFSI